MKTKATIQIQGDITLKILEFDLKIHAPNALVIGFPEGGGTPG